MKFLCAHAANFLVQLLAHFALSLNFGTVHGLNEPLNSFLFAWLEHKVVSDCLPSRLVLSIVDVVDQRRVTCSRFLNQCQVRLNDRGLGEGAPVLAFGNEAVGRVDRLGCVLVVVNGLSARRGIRR